MPHVFQPFSRLRPSFTAWVFLGSVLIAGAQLPSLPGKNPPKKDTPANAGETPEQLKQRLAKALGESRKQLAALDAAGPGTVPEGVTPAEVAERRADLVRTGFTLERHIKNLEALTVMGDTAKEAQRREQEWKGFEDPPPYSFLFYDELRNQRDAAKAKMDAFQSTFTLVERQIGAMQDEYRKAEENNRRAADEAARAKGSTAEPVALWRLESTAIRLRAIGSALALYQSGLTQNHPRLAAAKAELALLDRQLATIGDAVVFRDEDMAKAEKKARSRISAIEKELAGLAKQQSSVLAERDRVRAEIETLRAQLEADASKPRDALETAESRLRATEAEAEALSFQSELLGAVIRLQSETPAAIALRRDLLSADNAERRSEARKELQATAERARAWATFILNERAAVAAAVREQESRMAALPENDPRRPGEQRVLTAQWRKTETIERLDQVITGYRRSLDRWLDDDNRKLQERSLAARASDAGANLWGGLRKVWRFEVYRYEDKVEVDGETITVKRGLTLGWLLGALLFFLVAYRLTSWFSRRVQRTVVHRGWAGDAQARTLRRWAMVLVAVLLALITLHLLKIPVTAFAFLGGALAIGIGFGTQTLFKNFISGIIVLAERKVKVGDILDVDGIVGTVTTVDTRSSTIRGFDGVETLVPNSLLLENKVTNWTHTNARLRRVLRVGVAYGSPVQQVSEILSECAARHGLVLKDPAPLALFEDFGSDALVFALYFWVEIGERTNANVVASDLRFMLDKRFGEAGISVAFPQRDIHLTSGTPLRVEVVRENDAIR